MNHDKLRITHCIRGGSTNGTCGGLRSRRCGFKSRPLRQPRKGPGCRPRMRQQFVVVIPVSGGWAAYTRGRSKQPEDVLPYAQVTRQLQRQMDDAAGRSARQRPRTGGPTAPSRTGGEPPGHLIHHPWASAENQPKGGFSGRFGPPQGEGKMGKDGEGSGPGPREGEQANLDNSILFAIY